MLIATGKVSVNWCGERSLTLTRGRSRRPPPLPAYDGQDLSRLIDAIDWPGGFCRLDIGWPALAPHGA